MSKPSSNDGQDVTAQVTQSASDMYETVVEGEAPESTETNVRYMAYGSRIRTILATAHRYVAYTSDIGESFRPVAHPYLIRSAYAVSWLYLAGDVSNETYKAYLRNQSILTPIPATTLPNSATAFAKQKHDDPVPKIPLVEDYRVVGAQRAIFQTLASMALPAFTIHSTVKYAGRAMKDVKNVKLRTWGPIGLGLAVVPALPFIFDHPVETAVEYAFEKGAHAVEARQERKAALQEKKEL